MRHFVEKKTGEIIHVLSGDTEQIKELLKGNYKEMFSNE